MTDLSETHAPPDGPAPEEPRGEGSSPTKIAILAGLIGLAGLFGGVSMVIVIVSFVVMIFLHELGHFMAAKLNGMKVTEFFIGFGPRVWSFRRGETEYGLKAIPAGAYVRVIGMNSLDDEHDPAEEGRTYRQGSFPRRMLLAVAGSGMHFAQALVVLFVLYAFVGVPGGRLFPDDPPSVVSQVVEDSAAEAAGVQVGDTLFELDGEQVSTFRDFALAIRARPGESAILTVLRDGQPRLLEVVIGSVEAEDGAEYGALGVHRALPSYDATTVGVIDGMRFAGEDFVENTSEVLGFLGRFFSFSGLSSFGDELVSADSSGDTVAVATGGSASVGNGPEEISERPLSMIGAVRLGSDITDTGLFGFLAFYMSINITIGIVNLLPFPPLDGGHVVVAMYERIREGRSRKRHIVDYARVIPVAYAMILLLGIVFLTTTYLDILDAV